MASDPRVGSARDNGTSPGLSRLIQGSNSSSVNSLLATLIPVTVYALVCVMIFIVLRRQCPRVYEPRTFLHSLRSDERSPKLPGGWFNWIKPFYQIPDIYVLNHSSIDGYLFLRYIRILGIICAVGCLLTWPILLPLHATGGKGNTGLDILSMGNVSNPKWYYAHAALVWVYFGFILYMISRECVYFVNLRQAYLSSPLYAKRLSSRTVLFTSIPQRYLDEAKLRKLFGDSVRKVWIARNSRNLNDLIKERQQTAERLENAEILLIKMANFAKARAEHKRDVVHKTLWERTVKRQRKSERSEEGPSCDAPVNAVEVDATAEKEDFKVDLSVPLPNVNGSVASQWLSHSSRPHHRPIANYGRRVDTIKWTRLRLKKLSMKIRKLRRELLLEPKCLSPAAFVEFDSQEEAQIAYQTLPHHRPFQMSPRLIGVRPFEIVWDSLSMRWRELTIRRFLVKGFITVLIIFWAIPCALVGTISNIQYLATKVFFLHWLGSLPAPILGLLEGLLPAVALGLLMSIVPGILRSCARTAGTPTLAMVECYTQNSYFVFQVIQVFLVTTLTSAVSASLTNVLEHPPSATTLLSQNLPKASNFYLCYFFVQCMGRGATSLLHVLDLFKFHFLQSRTPSPRRLYVRWHKLLTCHWGGIFPVFTNLGVIAITYSCIAPVVLGFATLGTCFIHSTYKYNLLFVYDSEIDTKGLVYPRALMQTLTGVYLALICLIGLFALRAAIGPVVMTISLLIFTFLVHISLQDSLAPLLDRLPRTLAAESKNEDCIGYDIHNSNLEDRRLSFDHFDFLEDRDTVQEEEEDEVVHVPGATRAIEGASGAARTMGEELKPRIMQKIKSYIPIDDVLSVFGPLVSWLSPDPTVKPNFVFEWLYPQVYCDYSILRRMIPPESKTPEYSDEIERMVYYPPTFALKAPKLWIPRDAAGVSRQEVVHSGKVIDTSDEGAVLDKHGRVLVDYCVAGQEVLLEQRRF